jgi:putative transposase
VIRYDPKDLGEIRVYHQGRFLCRAICQELADRTIGLKEIVRARTQRRRQVGDTLRKRSKVVELLLASHPAEPPPESPPDVQPARPRLKRYVND